MDPFHNELKKEFQLERMILFSDAVFAIAITLLVIEIKVPELAEEHFTEKELLKSLGHLMPKIVGFLISFFLIGNYWMVHHRLFGYVVNYNKRLLWINLLFLLSIVLMPFSTGIFGEYSTPQGLYLKTPLIIYVLNICFIGFMLYRLWSYISNPVNQLAEHLPHPALVRVAKIRALLVPAIFLLSIPVSFIEPPFLSRYVFLLVFPIMRIIQKRADKKLKFQPQS
ncbi:DUF1211 domain-containing protein [Paraflavitalea soli]|uniref:DUF1211 domain-containing protein n=1 Tax=Paraflavitalea soli TaxID=2315862 RepID=A0A3B7MQ07_9BACT|nr:TMEM175 family protein [Paraflavitalea soli]AXY76582.1 DUF1211 domain-containing protein [Paraflavitalea soli]